MMEEEDFLESIKSLPDADLRKMLDPKTLNPAIYLLIVGELLLRHLKKDERAKYITKSD